MRARRLVFAVTVAFTALAAVAWRGSESLLKSKSLESLVPGRFYTIDCDEQGPVFDLEFGPETRYVMIVGNLTGGIESVDLTLSSQSPEGARILPARELGPLNTRASRFAQADHRGAHAYFAPQSDTTSDVLVENGPDREFSIHVTDGSPEDRRGYVRVVGRVVAEGREVRVYLDNQQSRRELAAGLLEEIVRLFDTAIVPRCAENLGTYRDVDDDGKFSILLSPWLGKLQGGETSLGGFVRGGDFRNDLESPFSNHCDMLYLNSNLRPDEHLETLLAHEFAHAVCFSERLLARNNRLGLPGQEDWLNEAIAHLSENLNGSGWTNLDYRISRYLNAPQNYSLVVDDYYRAGLWRDHGCRGATYLFLRWCVDQYGEELLKRLVRSPGRGRLSMEWATGIPFEQLFRHWSIALYQSGRLPRSIREKRSNQSARPNFSEGYRSIDLCGAVADWGLAGPHLQKWNLDEGERRIGLRGTSTLFIELTRPENSGSRRIVLDVDDEVRLQVSLIRLPEDWPRIQVECMWEEEQNATAIASTALDHKRLLRVEVSGDQSGQLQIEEIACERNYGQRKETYCFRGGSLERRLTDSRGDPSTNTKLYELSIPSESEFLGTETGRFVLKVVARDPHGRRATDWMIIDEADPSRVKLTGMTQAASRH